MQDFMRKTSIYEQKPGAFTPSLRHAARVGTMLTLLCALFIFLLPGIEGVIHVLFFPLLPAGFNTFLLAYIHWLAHTTELPMLEGFLIVSAGVLFLLTRNLRQGTAGQQWLAFIQALAGVFNTLLVLTPLLMLTLHLLCWLVVMLTVMLVVAQIIRMLAPR